MARAKPYLYINPSGIRGIIRVRVRPRDELSERAL